MSSMVDDVILSCYFANITVTLSLRRHVNHVPSCYTEHHNMTSLRHNHLFTSADGHLNRIT